jgi:hypothetical protein
MGSTGPPARPHPGLVSLGARAGALPCGQLEEGGGGGPPRLAGRATAWPPRSPPRGGGGAQPLAYSILGLLSNDAAGAFACWSALLKHS